MLTSSTWSTPVRRHLVAMATVALFGPISACNEGAEGDRCNPDLSHDECGAGLTCQTPSDPKTGATCGESYCCPTPASSSSNSYCNGSNFGEIVDGVMNCPVPEGAAPAPSSGDSSTEGGPSEAAAAEGVAESAAE